MFKREQDKGNETNKAVFTQCVNSKPPLSQNPPAAGRVHVVDIDEWEMDLSQPIVQPGFYIKG